MAPGRFSIGTLLSGGSADDELSASLPNEELVAAANRVVGQLCKDQLDLSLSAPDIKHFTIFDSVAASDIEDVMRLARQDVRCKRAMGAMVGMAVCDSVGGQLEFLPVGQKGSHFNPKTLEAVGQYNKFHLKPGQWTDDTSMGLCIADSLLCRTGYDGSDMRIRFWNWWHKGYNNSFRLDQERTDSVGLGGNIWLSLMVMTQASYILGPRYEGFGEDAGNGSLMRLAPVPIFFHADIDLAMRVSAESSYTTHPGPSAADACAFLGFGDQCDHAPNLEEANSETVLGRVLRCVPRKTRGFLAARVDQTAQKCRGEREHGALLELARSQGTLPLRDDRRERKALQWLPRAARLFRVLQHGRTGDCAS